MELSVKITNTSSHDLPAYATSQSAGMDLRAWLPDGPVTLLPGEHKLIKTGLSIELPQGHEAQVRPRSGLALKHGVTVLNSPGTIDADYRGEIGVILINHSKTPFVVENGERVAQLVVQAYARVSWLEVNALSETERGAGGFGHSGKH